MSKFAPGTTAVSNETLAHLLLCSFRYSLGRQTYITGSCREWLETYWHLMPCGWQEQIHRDINHAIEHGAAGHADLSLHHRPFNATNLGKPEVACLQ